MTTMNTKKALLSTVSLLSFLVAPALANPQDGTVVSGSVTINQAGKVTTITSTTGKTIINWSDFSIGRGEVTRFVQPSKLAAVLNRVTGLDPSVIQGSLSSNGRVFLLNPNGILFGPTAKVDVGSLVASTLSMNDQDFLNDNFKLFQDSSKAMSYVVNQGQITARDRGSVILVAPLVDNEGVIVANLGSAQLAAGTEAVVDLDGVVSLVLPDHAPGDVVAANPSALLKAVVNHDGILPAGSLEGNVLKGAEGLVVNGGTIQGDTIVVDSTTATVLAPGSVAQAATSVQALSQGNTIFSPGASMSAPFVEVSAVGNVVVQGDVTADTFLIDPTTLRIVNGTGGSQDGTLPDIFFGDPNLGANTVSETALETQTANVVLQATDSIIVNDIADGEITLQNNVGFAMATQTGSIFFADTTDTVHASGTGSIAVDSGGGATLGRFVTENQAIDLRTAGNLSIRRANAGSADLTLTSGGTILDGDTGAALNLTGGMITMTATNGIGLETNPIEVNTAHLSTQVMAEFGVQSIYDANGYDTLSVTSDRGVFHFTGGDTLQSDTNNRLEGHLPGTDLTLSETSSLGLLSFVKLDLEDGTLHYFNPEGSANWLVLTPEPTVTAHALEFQVPHGNFFVNDLDVVQAAGTAENVGLYAVGDLRLAKVGSSVGVTATDNQVNIYTTAGTLYLSSLQLGTGPAIQAPGTVTLYGSVVGDADDSSPDIVSQRLSVLADNAVGTLDFPVETQIESLSAGSQTLGSIFVRELDDLTLNGHAAPNLFASEIGISVGGNLTLDPTHPVTATNQLSLRAGGNITGAGLASHLVTFQAGGDIALNELVFDSVAATGQTIRLFILPDSYSQEKEHGIGRYTSLTNGAFVNGLRSAGDLWLQSLDTSNPDSPIFGNLHLDDGTLGARAAVAANGTAELQFGEIMGDTDDTFADIVAPGLGLGWRFGLVDPIETDVDKVAGGEGSLVEKNGLTIGSVRAAFQGPGFLLVGLGGGQRVNVRVLDGNLRVGDARSGGSVVDAENVSLEAVHGSILSAAGPQVSIVSPFNPGSLFLSAAGSIGTAETPLRYQGGLLAVESGGSVYLSASGAMRPAQVASGLDPGHVVTGVNAAGLASLGTTESSSLYLDEVSLGTAPAIQGGSGVQLNIAATVRGDEDDTAADIVAPSVSIVAGRTILPAEVSASHLDLQVTGTGSATVHGTSTETLVVDSARTSNGGLGLTALGDLSLLDVEVAGTLSVAGQEVRVANVVANDIQMTGLNIVSAVYPARGKLTADTISLTATEPGDGNITLDVTADSLEASATRSIQIYSRDHDLHAANVVSSTTDGIIELATVGSGDLFIGTAQADQVRLLAAGSLLEDGSDETPDAIGREVKASANQQVSLQTDAASLLTLSKGPGGGIDIRNTTHAPSTDLFATTVDGPIRIITNNDLNLRAVAAKGSDNDIFLKGEDVAVYDVVRALGGTITVEANTVGVPVNGTVSFADFNARKVVLNTVHGIGEDRVVEVDAARLTATASGQGDIRVKLLNSGPLTVDGASTADGDIALDAAGQLTLLSVDAVGSLTASAGDIRVARVEANDSVMLQSRGRIRELGTDAEADIVAGADSRLQAAQDIGYGNSPEVYVTGSLSVWADGQVGGVSVNLDGVVSPTNTLIVLNTPPGQVLFNGVPVP